VSDTSSSPTFEIICLGHTELHDVYHVAIYRGLVADQAAQHRYKQQVAVALRQAKSNWRSIWVAVDLSHLSTKEFIYLSYRIGLPFMGEPMKIKVYGLAHITVQDDTTKRLDWLIRHTFKIESVPNRVAALPPEFAGEA
jgi:hypothetical protein